MLNLSRNEISNEDFKRRRARDQAREEKINHFTQHLKAESITTGMFLEAMANKKLLPEIGKQF